MVARKSGTATKKAPARSTRRAPAKPDYASLKFEFGEISDTDDLLNEIERYIEHVNERKPLASSKDKAQYWAGQGQAMKAFRAAVNAWLGVDPDAEDDAEDEANAA
jgi:hypothetical protein